MAIYHFDASVISRSKGRSSTAAAAYRTSERITDHRTGEVHDYTRKAGVEHTEIIAPDHAPDWAHDRSALWNAVEQIERRKDAQVSREVRVALPSELTLEQNRDMVREFVRSQFVDRGMVADVALHAPGREGDQRNHHAHIMLTTREIGPDGFGAKNRDWNAKDLLQDWRQSWAEHVNHTFERNHVNERVDHRTLEAQRDEALERAAVAEDRGDERSQVEHMARAVELDRPALPSMSAGSWSMMRRGLGPPAMERWQEVKHIGAQVREVAQEFQSRATEWLERVREVVRPQTAMERLQAAREGFRGEAAPQTALERLQTARESVDVDRSAEVARNEELAGHDLKQQDTERESLEQERVLKLEREVAREKNSHTHSR
jgi:ATP-dependent exoDNAse (exonuclease V) alpha subunit